MGLLGGVAVTGDLGAHLGVRGDIFVFGEVHDAELAVAEGLRNGERDLSFGFDDLRAHLLCAGGHFLFQRHGCGAATIGYTGNAAIGAVTTFSLSGVTATPVVFLGASLLNAPLCPACVLGANPDVVVPGATLPLTIPNFPWGGGAVARTCDSKTRNRASNMRPL